MDDPSRRARLLRRMAWLCFALVLAITSLSAFIRLARAGAGCADGAACHGWAVRAQPLEGASISRDSAAVVVARIAHRLLAGAVLVLVVAMAMTCLLARPRWWREGRRALALVALVVFLAVLGRWSAAPHGPAITVFNLLAGFALLALAWNLARTAGRVPRARSSALLRAWAVAAAVLVGVEIALGGLVGAGQQAHCLVAVLLAAVALPLGAVALRRGSRAAGAALLGLVAAQIGLGTALVVGALPLPVALGHNVLAGLLLVVTVELASPALR